MLMRILLSVFVGIVVGIATYVLGVLLSATGITVVVSLGAVLKAVSTLVGIAAALWFFVTGRTTFLIQK